MTSLHFVSTFLKSTTNTCRSETKLPDRRVNKKFVSVGGKPGVPSILNLHVQELRVGMHWSANWFNIRQIQKIYKKKILLLHILLYLYYIYIFSKKVLGKLYISVSSESTVDEWSGIWACYECSFDFVKVLTGQCP